MVNHLKIDVDFTHLWIIVQFEIHGLDPWVFHIGHVLLVGFVNSTEKWIEMNKKVGNVKYTPIKFNRQMNQYDSPVD